LRPAPPPLANLSGATVGGTSAAPIGANPPNSTEPFGSVAGAAGSISGPTIPSQQQQVTSPTPLTKAVPEPTQPPTTPPVQVAALPPGQIYGAQNRNPRLILRVHVATRILVQGPKKAVFINRILKPGDTYQVPNAVGITLTTPNGGAVELDLDGQAMGFAGRDQQMTEALSLDPQAVVDRYNRQ
jgi:cytoskeleton protein RodZ